MSLTTSAIHRAGWQARVTIISRAIDDLRLEITIALQAKVNVATMKSLGEADVHLEIAQNELREATNRIEQIMERGTL